MSFSDDISKFIGMFRIACATLSLISTLQLLHIYTIVLLVATPTRMASISIELIDNL